MTRVLTYELREAPLTDKDANLRWGVARYFTLIKHLQPHLNPLMFFILNDLLSIDLKFILKCFAVAKEDSPENVTSSPWREQLGRKSSW